MNNERVLLVKPFSGIRAHDIYSPDIGLGYLATSLLNAGFGVNIQDFHYDIEWRQSLKKVLYDYKIKVFGIKFYSKDIPIVKKMLSFVRGLHLDLILIGGGPFPSGDPENVLNIVSELDFAFHGEGEKGLSDFMKLLKANNYVINKLNSGLNKIPGLIFKNNDNIYFNKPYFEDNLNSLGFPAWNILNPQKYKQNWTLMGDYVPIMTSRGCPMACTYCAGSTITGKKLRYRTLDHVFEEIDYLIKHFNVKHFSICDDNFTFDRDYVIGFCEKFIKLNDKITWDLVQNAIRLDNVDEKLIKMIEKSRCTGLTIAAESGSDRILKDMRKGFDSIKIKRAVNIIRSSSSKIFLGAYFIVGYPEESELDIKKSIKLALDIDVDAADFFIYTPHPGSPMYKKLIMENRLKEIDWDLMLYEKASIPTKYLSVKEVELLQSLAYRKFFIRPKVLYKFGKKVFKMDKKRFVNFARRGFYLLFERDFKRLKLKLLDVFNFIKGEY